MTMKGHHLWGAIARIYSLHRYPQGQKKRETKGNQSSEKRGGRLQDVEVKGERAMVVSRKVDCSSEPKKKGCVSTTRKETIRQRPHRRSREQKERTARKRILTPRVEKHKGGQIWTAPTRERRTKKACRGAGKERTTGNRGGFFCFLWKEAKRAPAGKRQRVGGKKSEQGAPPLSRLVGSPALLSCEKGLTNSKKHAAVPVNRAAERGARKT